MAILILSPILIGSVVFVVQTQIAQIKLVLSGDASVSVFCIMQMHCVDIDRKPTKHHKEHSVCFVAAYDGAQLHSAMHFTAR